MKFLRPALMVALLSIISASAAFADDIHVIFDPQQISDPANNSFNPVVSLTNPISFTWGSCANDIYVQGTPLATETACANFANLTGVAITQLVFTFLADPSLPNHGADEVSCESIDPNLSDASCPTDTVFGAGDPVSTTFSGGTPIPPSPSNTNLSVFFLAEDGVALDKINTLTWTVSASEPSSISLLAAGMGLLGLGLVLAKR
jgi:hypothetical protein